MVAQTMGEATGLAREGVNLIDPLPHITEEAYDGMLVLGCHLPEITTLNWDACPSHKLVRVMPTSPNFRGTIQLPSQARQILAWSCRSC